MKFTRQSLCAILLLSSASAAFADATMKADRQSADQACAADAATAGCSNEQAGKGLMKCLEAYHKANPTWKPSEACEAARKQMHSDKAAEKAAKPN